MITNLIQARIDKLNSLNEKYENILSFSTIEPLRKVQVKAYIHCFRDELEFLTSLNEDPSDQNTNFENDDEEF